MGSNDNDVGAGMSLVMVEHPSGYGYKSHSEPDGSEAIKLRESDSDKTTLYFDDLQTEREATVCFAYHTKVANPKPAFVSVQDYYNTEAKSDQQFSLDGRQVSRFFDWFSRLFDNRKINAVSDVGIN